MKYFNRIFTALLFMIFVLSLFMNLRDVIGNLLYSIMNILIWVALLICEFLRVYRAEGKRRDYFGVIAIILVAIISLCSF